MRFIEIVVESQKEVVVQPRNAEAYDFPSSIVLECRELVGKKEKPVILIGKNGDRAKFYVEIH